MSRGLSALARRRRAAVDEARQALAQELAKLARLDRLSQDARSERNACRRKADAGACRARPAHVLQTEHAWLAALELRLRRLEEARAACFESLRQARRALLEAEQAHAALDVVLTRRSRRRARRLELLDEARTEDAARQARQGGQG